MDCSAVVAWAAGIVPVAGLATTVVRPATASEQPSKIAIIGCARRSAEATVVVFLSRAIEFPFAGIACDRNHDAGRRTLICVNALDSAADCGRMGCFSECSPVLGSRHHPQVTGWTAVGAGAGGIDGGVFDATRAHDRALYAAGYSPAAAVRRSAGRRRPQRRAHFSTPCQDSQAAGKAIASDPKKTCHHRAWPPDRYMTSCSAGQP